MKRFGSRITIIMLFIGNSLFSNSGTPDFSNKTINDIESYAITSNPLYLAEKKNIGITRSEELTAALYRNPVLSFQQQFLPAGGSPRNDAFGRPIEEGGSIESAFAITQDLDIFGIIGSRKKLAKTNVDYQISGFKNFDRLFRLKLRQNYWAYIYFLELIKFQKEYYENYKELFEMNKFRAEKGDISPLELERLELERIRIEKIVQEAEIQKNVVGRDLSLLIGIPQANLNISGKLSFEPLKNLGIVFEQIQFDNRPDYKGQEQKVLQGKLLKELREKESYQFFNLGGEVRKKSNEGYLGVFASIPLRIFDRNQGEIQKAVEMGKKAALDLAAKKKEITAEVENAKVELTMREKMLEAYDSINYVEKNKSVYEKYKFAYIKGATNLVTYLEAEKNYLYVLRNYYEQVFLYRNAIEAYRSAAGLLTSLTDKDLQ